MADNEYRDYLFQEGADEDISFYEKATRALSQGLLRTGELTGYAMQTLDPEGGNEWLQKKGEDLVSKMGELRKQPDSVFSKPYLTGKEGTVERGVLSGLESFVSSAAPLAMGGAALLSLPATATAGTAALAFGAASTAGVVGLFGFGTYGQASDQYDQVKGVEGNPEERHNYALQQALVEGGIEEASNLLGGYIFKIFGPAVKQPFKETVKQILTTPTKELVKEGILNMGQETATEMLQGALGAKLDQKYLDETGMDAWTAAKESIIPSITMSILFGMGATGMTYAKRRQFINDLNSEDTQKRMDSVQQIYGNLVQAYEGDRTAADSWAAYAMDRINNAEPIPINDKFTDYAVTQMEKDISVSQLRRGITDAAIKQSQRVLLEESLRPKEIKDDLSRSVQSGIESNIDNTKIEVSNILSNNNNIYNILTKYEEGNILSDTESLALDILNQTNPVVLDSWAENRAIQKLSNEKAEVQAQEDIIAPEGMPNFDGMPKMVLQIHAYREYNLDTKGMKKAEIADLLKQKWIESNTQATPDMDISSVSSAGSTNEVSPIPDYASMPLMALKAQARDMGIDSSGSQKQLAARLTSYAITRSDSQFLEPMFGPMFKRTVDRHQWVKGAADQKIRDSYEGTALSRLVKGVSSLWDKVDRGGVDYNINWKAPVGKSGSEDLIASLTPSETMDIKGASWVMPSETKPFLNFYRHNNVRALLESITDPDVIQEIDGIARELLVPIYGEQQYNERGWKNLLEPVQGRGQMEFDDPAMTIFSILTGGIRIRKGPNNTHAIITIRSLPTQQQIQSIANEFIKNGIEKIEIGFQDGMEVKGYTTINIKGMSGYEALNAIEMKIREQIGGVYFARTEKELGKKGLTSKQVRKVAQKYTKGWKNLRIDDNMFIYGSKRELLNAVDSNIKNFIANNGISLDEVKSFYYNGELHILAPNLKSNKDVVKIILHEGITHFGLRGAFNSIELDNFLEKVMNDVGIAQMKKYLKEQGYIYDHLPNNYWGNLRLTEEYIATMAENNEAGIKKVWNDLIALIHKLVSAITGTDYKWTNAEIHNMLRKSKRWLKEGQNMNNLAKIWEGNIPAMARLRSAQFFSPMKAFMDKPNNGVPNNGTADLYADFFDNAIKAGHIKKSEYMFSGVGIWLDVLQQNNPDKVINRQDIVRVLNEIQFTIRPVRHRNYSGMTIKEGRGKKYEYFNLTLHMSTKEIDKLWNEWHILKKRMSEAPTTAIRNQMKTRMDQIVEEIGDKNPMYFKSPLEIGHGGTHMGDMSEAYDTQPITNFNELAHVRFTISELKNGENMLVINEVQSDWVQKARKRVKGTDKQMFLTQQEAREIWEAKNAYLKVNREYIAKFQAFVPSMLAVMEKNGIGSDFINSEIRNLTRAGERNGSKSFIDWADYLSSLMKKFERRQRGYLNMSTYAPDYAFTDEAIREFFNGSIDSDGWNGLDGYKVNARFGTREVKGSEYRALKGNIGTPDLTAEKSAEMLAFYKITRAMSDVFSDIWGKIRNTPDREAFDDYVKSKLRDALNDATTTMLRSSSYTAEQKEIIKSVMVDISNSINTGDYSFNFSDKKFIDPKFYKKKSTVLSLINRDYINKAIEDSSKYVTEYERARQTDIDNSSKYSDGYPYPAMPFMGSYNDATWSDQVVKYVIYAAANMGVKNVGVIKHWEQLREVEGYRGKAMSNDEVEYAHKMYKKAVVQTATRLFFDEYPDIKSTAITFIENATLEEIMDVFDIKIESVAAKGVEDLNYKKQYADTVKKIVGDKAIKIKDIGTFKLSDILSDVEYTTAGKDEVFQVKMGGMEDPLISATSYMPFDPNGYITEKGIKTVLIDIIQGNVFAETPNIWYESTPTFSFAKNKFLNKIVDIYAEQAIREGEKLKLNLDQASLEISRLADIPVAERGINWFDQYSAAISKHDILINEYKESYAYMLLQKKQAEEMLANSADYVNKSMRLPDGRVVEYNSLEGVEEGINRYLEKLNKDLNKRVPTTNTFAEKLRKSKEYTMDRMPSYDDSGWVYALRYKRIWDRYATEVPQFIEAFIKQWGLTPSTYILKGTPTKVLRDYETWRDPNLFLVENRDQQTVLVYDGEVVYAQPIAQYDAMIGALRDIKEGKSFVPVRVKGEKVLRVKKPYAHDFDDHWESRELISQLRKLYPTDKIVDTAYNFWAEIENWGERYYNTPHDQIGEDQWDELANAIEEDAMNQARDDYRDWWVDSEERDEDDINYDDMDDSFLDDAKTYMLDEFIERIHNKTNYSSGEVSTLEKERIKAFHEEYPNFGQITDSEVNINYIIDIFHRDFSTIETLEEANSGQRFERSTNDRLHAHMDSRLEYLCNGIGYRYQMNAGEEGKTVLIITDSEGKQIFSKEASWNPDEPDVNKKLAEKWYKRYELMTEGFNAVWDILQNQPEQIKAVQEITGFTMNDKMFNDVLDNNIPMFSRVQQQSQATTDTEVFYDEISEPSMLDRITQFFTGGAESFDDWKNKKITQVFDKLRPILDQIDRGVQEVDMRSYTQFRMISNVNSILDAFLHHGGLKLKNRNSLIITEKNKGLIPFLNKLKGKDATNALTWIAAKRAEALLDKDARDHANHPNLRKYPDEKIGRMDREWIASILESDWAQAGPETSGMTWESINGVFQDYNKNILDLAEKTGLITEEARAEWEQHYYVPFFKILEDDTYIKNILPRQFKKNISAGIVALRGSDKPMGDPLTNMLRSWGRLIEQSMRNLAMERAYINGKNSGAIETFENAQGQYDDNAYRQYLQANPRGKNEKQLQVLSFMKDGKPIYFSIKDPELFNALADVRYNDFNNMLMNLMKGSKRALTFGVTFGVPFRIANFFRDSFSTYLVERDFIPIIDSIRGFYKVWRNDPAFLALQASGGTFTGGFLDKNSKEELKKLSKTIAKREGQGALKNILDTPKKIYDFWQKVGMASEMAARTQLYANLTQEGQSIKGLFRSDPQLTSHLEAAFRAKDILDFNKMGGSKAVNMLVQMMPFMNARLQGLHKIGQQGVGTEGKKAFYLKGVALSLASLALWSMFKDDDRYKQLDDWEKWNYYHFWIGDEHYRLPKPFELGMLFSSFPEAFGNIVNDQSVEAKHALDLAMFVIRQTLSLDVVPQAVKPAYEIWSNYSSFFGREIVPQHMKGSLPEHQYYPWTNDTLKGMAKQFGFSPLKAEYLINGYLGAFGMFILGATDVAYEALVDLPEKPKQRWYEGPITRRFVKDASVPNAQRATKMLYDLYAEAEQVAQTIKHYKESGDWEAVRRIRSESLPLIQYRSFLRKRVKIMADYRKRINKVLESKHLSGEEKRRMIDMLATRRNRMVLNLYDRLVRLKQRT